MKKMKKNNHSEEPKKDKREPIEKILIKNAFKIFLTAAQAPSTKNTSRRLRTNINFREYPENIAQYEYLFELLPSGLFASISDLYRGFIQMAFYVITTLLESEAEKGGMTDIAEKLHKIKELL